MKLKSYTLKGFIHWTTGQKTGQEPPSTYASVIGKQGGQKFPQTTLHIVAAGDNITQEVAHAAWHTSTADIFGVVCYMAKG